MSAVEKEFIFDAVVGFLTSPIWNSPVRTFIEQNSLGMNNVTYITGFFTSDTLGAFRINFQFSNIWIFVCHFITWKVFDADGENHEAYQEIHKKYKEMVRITN